MTQAQPRPRKPATPARKQATRALEAAKSRHPASVIPFPAGPPPPFKGIVLLVLMLMAAFSLLGLIMVLSSSMVIDLDSRGSALFHFHRQLIWVGLGWGLLVFTSLVDYRRWAKFATPMLICSLGAFRPWCWFPALGVTVNGATRWLQIGPVVFQPCRDRQVRADRLGWPGFWQRATSIFAIPASA